MWAPINRPEPGLVSVDTPEAKLAANVRGCMGQHPDSYRAGKFTIGISVSLSRIVGNFLQDEKFPRGSGRLRRSV